MTTIGLSYSLVKRSTKCAPALRLIRRSILRDAVQANLFQRLNFVVAQEAGVASFIATAQQKFKHRTGYMQPLFIQHRLQPAC